MRKKLIYSTVILSFLAISYYTVGLSIGDTNHPLINKVKSIVPNKAKQMLKDTLYSFDTKTKVSAIPKKLQDTMPAIVSPKILEELKEKERQLKDKDKQLADLENENKRLDAEWKRKYDQLKYENVLEKIDKQKIFPFKFRENRLEGINEASPLYNFKGKRAEKIGDTNVEIQTFESPVHGHLGPRAYLEYYNNNLFLIAGNGLLLHMPIKNIAEAWRDPQGKNLLGTKIQTNFSDIAGKDYLKKQNPFPTEKKILVTDLLAKKGKLYIAYVKRNIRQTSQDSEGGCFDMSVLRANLDLDKMVFEEFFSTNECQPLSLGAEGGKLSDFTGNKILLTIGDYSAYEIQWQRFGRKNNGPQEAKVLTGKIISINEDTKEYKILSMGHRNPQGLFYDKENKTIFSTEHGPNGGDEINVNINPEDGKIKNYGWGISSYGEHYGFIPGCDCMHEQYKSSPLHKSHKDYGFIEPLKDFTPAIGISEIIKTEQFINIPDKKILYVAAMGHDSQIEEGDQSIHQFVLNADLTIEKHNVLPIGERIRSMIYVKELDKILLVMETLSSIGILGKAN